ncbi:MAG: hypothetical protein ACFCAD_08935 [Pleurocapsa sp.]
MLINRHQTVYLSFISTDFPVWNVIEATASLYQKDQERFHLLLNQQNLPQSVFPDNQEKFDRGLFWLEITPYRVILTMQSNNRLSYRHFWEKGIYGVSRYCLSSDPDEPGKSIRFSNFTRYLKVEQDVYPKNVRIEYEMWSEKVQLGS